jgi:hypothetical protein
MKEYREEHREQTKEYSKEYRKPNIKGDCEERNIQRCFGILLSIKNARDNVVHRPKED